ncbi:DNA mismatch repair endonuclease MutL [Psychrobacter phenylpyruvicus]|uniref:DNA mismatch repair protein MutL n=1 Tax=Psychrobacter phenylpyruvicus TaxID=29432 RepID=A0A379LN60_9GAMM|nr:DNA mismatch repair endonuclease MutL [Psychrobacter phenylpyruvicus]SUD91214.1 DNA mismatch repair protein mutL [Psychrobacter phenylpyruvicus]
MTFSSNSTSLSQEQAAAAAGGSNRIKKLPPLLVNQLAAGEVVTRPASVVKELIENAIDAGAKHIDIRITQGGMGIIEVADDGCGIHPDDMIMAVTRFATSKIADVAHLQGIATLGFRGEALAATAAVSRLTLTSCSDDSGIGRELNVAGILEDTPQLIPVVRAKGTTVTVKDLYFNVPARRGNLKSISTEYAHIEMVVKQLALVASDVSFTLWHNDKRRFNFESIASSDKGSTYSISASEAMKPTVMQSVLARLTALLPTSHDQAELLSDSNLQPINISLEGLRPQSAWQEGAEENLAITGFLIPSSRAVSNSSYKLIYINGRLIKDRRISQSIRDSAANLSGINSLGYVLFFNLPKAWLNLNVHPSKQCIKIQNLANVMAHLEVGVRDALQLWQHRQPAQVADQEGDDSQLIAAIDSDSAVPSQLIDNGNDYFINSSINKGDKHLTNNFPKVQQPKVDYKLSEVHNDLSRKAKNSASSVIASEQELQTLSTQNVAASIAGRIEATEIASNQLIGLAILDKTQIPQALLDKLQINKLNNKPSLSLSDTHSLLLIQANQSIYLMTEQGLKSGLQSISIEVPPDLSSLQTASSGLQSLSELNWMLSRVGPLSAIDHQQLLAKAITKLSLLELAVLMIERL